MKASDTAKPRIIWKGSANDAKILALCAPMLKRIWRQSFGGEENGFNLCLAKGVTQQANTSRNVPRPPSLGNRERLYSLGLMVWAKYKAQSNEGLAFLCSANSRPKLASGGSATGSDVPEVIGHDLLSEMKSATRECRGRRNARCKG